MVEHAYYLIQPTQALRSLLRTAGYGDDSFFSSSRLWSNDEGDRSVWDGQDYETLVKVAFIVWFFWAIEDTPHLSPPRTRQNGDVR
jgi:hypothetical protein